MRTCEFHFDLPDELIAQHPCEQRSSSRLLHLSRTSGNTPNLIQHQQFKDLPEILNAGDLLVFNDTRVIPARLFGKKITGGKVEILIERLLDEQRCLAQIRSSKTPKDNSVINIENKKNSKYELTVETRQDDMFILSSKQGHKLSEIMEQAGHMPLPPYITRTDNFSDLERYQTVFSRRPGAVAAPTAGLHFDDEIMNRLEQKGIQTTFITLHVGAGTFQPVRTENIEDHRMHSEYLEVNQETVDLCLKTRQRGGRIIAVGTTSVRSLETASASGILKPYTGETDIFIKPGYKFVSVDAMITNFHLPESTLLMLVSAFSDRDSVFNAYNQAVEMRYRFFSYGDTMLID